MSDKLRESNATKSFINDLFGRVVNLFGPQSIASLVTSKFPDKALTYDGYEVKNIAFDDYETMQKLVRTLLDLIESTMGFSVSENIIVKMYAETVKGMEDSVGVVLLR
ncbi:MAG: hypothetical protein AAB968_00415, partial [Patescibacteria group bacterium]